MTTTSRLKTRKKEWAQRVYLNAPYPVSRWLYSMGKSYFFKDARSITFEKIFAHTAQNRIEGDYLEFGCYRGASLIMSYMLARKYRLSKMRFFAFDSFAGLPESEGTNLILLK